MDDQRLFCKEILQSSSNLILLSIPDIIIIVECDHPVKILFQADLPKATDTLWSGKNLHEKPHYIDFCFVASDLKAKLQSVQIGEDPS